MSLSQSLVIQLLGRGESGDIRDADLDAFLKAPGLWRKSAAAAAPFTLESAQAFWQGVWDELGIKVEVPPVPKLTDKQVKSLEKFGFLLVYVPAITEEQYPTSFVKPRWFNGAERMPLVGKWVAVETIAKPHWDDLKGYVDDRLMAAIKCEKRFNVRQDDLTGGLLAKIAKSTGFPKRGTRIPSAEEWNLIGNLFNWLRNHRQMDLPDLGSTRSWEWCSNACGSEFRLIAGSSDGGGLADVGSDWRDGRSGCLAFRVLADL